MAGQAKRHGRFVRTSPFRRKINGLHITIDSKDTCYVYSETLKYTIVFHRWWQGRGSYGCWRYFTQCLVRYQNLDLSKIISIANRWDIEHQVSRYNVIIEEKEEA